MSSSSPARTSSPRRALPRLSPQLARAGAAAGRARLSVVPRLRRRAHRVPFVTLVSLLLLGGVVGLLLFNTSMQQASFAAADLERQAAMLSAREQALALELDELRNPERLARRACDLGMIAGPSAAFIDLATGKVTGKPTAATRTPAGTLARPAPGAAPRAAARCGR